jgi:uncharacterized protein
MSVDVVFDPVVLQRLAAAGVRARACEQAVPSPCQSVCAMHKTHGLCAGCLRTIDEIRAWSRLDDEAKRQLWTVIDGRCQQWSPSERSLP